MRAGVAADAPCVGTTRPCHFCRYPFASFTHGAFGDATVLRLEYGSVAQAHVVTGGGVTVLDAFLGAPCVGFASAWNFRRYPFSSLTQGALRDAAVSRLEYGSVAQAHVSTG